MIMLLLIIFTSGIKLAAKLYAVFVIQKTSMILIYGIGYLQNIIIGYVGLIIFSMAVTLLLEDESITTRGESLQETQHIQAP